MRVAMRMRICVGGSAFVYGCVLCVRICKHLSAYVLYPCVLVWECVYVCYFVFMGPYCVDLCVFMCMCELLCDCVCA